MLKLFIGFVVGSIIVGAVSIFLIIGTFATSSDCVKATKEAAEAGRALDVSDFNSASEYDTCMNLHKD